MFFLALSSSRHLRRKVKIGIKNFGITDGSEIDGEWLQNNDGSTDKISAGTDPFHNFKKTTVRDTIRHPVRQAQFN